MLVLNRKTGQQIRIGDTVEVTVLSTRKGQVKLGFTAPPDVTIYRTEIEPSCMATIHGSTMTPHVEHAE